MGKFSNSSGDLGKGAKIAMVLLVIINIVFILLGIATLGVGAWAIASGNSFAFLTGNQIIGGSAVLIITGIAIAIIAAVGLLGAMCRNRFLLFIYSIVVLLIVIIEIAVGIAAFIYRNEVAAGIQSGIQDNLIANYDASTPGSDANTVIDFFQSTFACCGFNNASDWVMDNLPAITQSGGRPPNCLVCDVGGANADCQTFEYEIPIPGTNMNATMNFNTTNVGCASVNTNALLALAVGAGVVGIIVGILEISGIIVALLLCCCISRSKEQTVV